MTENVPQPKRPSTREDFERDVVARANADPAFRSALVADPRAAIKAAYGIELPPGVDLQVLEETASRFYLVLPPQSAELTDEDLAKVAGGVGMGLALDHCKAMPNALRSPLSGLNFEKF